MSRTLTALAAVLAVTAVFAAAACSANKNEPRVAAAAQRSSPTSQATSSSGPLAFSQCMRAHGISDFPDPSTNGNIAFNATGVSQATYQSAQNACQGLLNKGGSSGSGVSEQQLAKDLKFSKCMRAHGVTNFPDPNAQGDFSGSGSAQGNNPLNPMSPQFQNAQAICFKVSGLSAPGGSS